MLVSEMGGRMEVQSVVGRGTVFRVILDLAEVSSIRKP
jgi:signal transduction histidine kinase